MKIVNVIHLLSVLNCLESQYQANYPFLLCRSVFVFINIYIYIQKEKKISNKCMSLLVGLIVDLSL